MIQSMEILQLPIMALQERIEQEMEDNPVLDQVEPIGRDRRERFEDDRRESPTDPTRWPTPSASWSSKTARTTRTTSNVC